MRKSADLSFRGLKRNHTVLLFCFDLDQDELAYPAHHMVFETTSRNQGSELSGSTMSPQMTVVADLTCSEYQLSLKPGYTVEEIGPHGAPQTMFMGSVLLLWNFGSDVGNALWLLCCVCTRGRAATISCSAYVHSAGTGSPTTK